MPENLFMNFAVLIDDDGEEHLEICSFFLSLISFLSPKCYLTNLVRTQMVSQGTNCNIEIVGNRPGEKAEMPVHLVK